MDRRRLIGLLAATTALEGCSSSLVGRTLGNALQQAINPSSAFDPEYPERLKYASIGVMIQDKPRALLILAKAENEELHWMSADRGVLVTRRGRLVRTAGFQENLLRTEFIGSDFFAAAATLETTTSPARRMVDIEPGSRYGVRIEATLIPGKYEEIRIGRRIYSTRQFDEHCSAPQLAWEFTNRYWMDQQGMIWRSIQHATPGQPPLQIEITKAPAA